MIYLKRNIRNKASVQALTTRLQSVGKVPLLIAIDQEGGRIDKLTEVLGFRKTPSAEDVARTMDVQAAKALYKRVASDLSGWGFNMNFAPVVDVNVNPANPIIGRLREKLFRGSAEGREVRRRIH